MGGYFAHLDVYERKGILFIFDVSSLAILDGLCGILVIMMVFRGYFSHFSGSKGGYFEYFDGIFNYFRYLECSWVLVTLGVTLSNVTSFNNLLLN